MICKQILKSIDKQTFLGMSKERFGRHFIIGLSGPSLSSADIHALRELQPAGVILRAHNFDHAHPQHHWIRTLRELLDGVQNETHREKPIVAIDHEGGRVHRVPAPLTHFPAACSYGCRAADVARAMAIELASIGINLSFAPVADIHSNPKNPVIGERSFGSDPQMVAQASVSFARALLANGVVPVAKHFPGHGDTLQDSHEELPVLAATMGQLEKREIIPFKAVVEAHLPAILTAHILFPEIDALPATMSRKLISELLRDRLGFNGVIISDDLDMKAIALHYSPEVVARHVLGAGCDILLFNHDPQRALAVRDLIESYLDSGLIAEADFVASDARVLNFLDHVVPKSVVSELPATVLAEHQHLNQLLRV